MLAPSRAYSRSNAFAGVRLLCPIIVVAMFGGVGPPPSPAAIPASPLPAGVTTSSALGSRPDTNSAVPQGDIEIGGGIGGTAVTTSRVVVMLAPSRAYSRSNAFAGVRLLCPIIVVAMFGGVGPPPSPAAIPASPLPAGVTTSSALGSRPDTNSAVPQGDIEIVGGIGGTAVTTSRVVAMLAPSRAYSRSNAFAGVRLLCPIIVVAGRSSAAFNSAASIITRASDSRTPASNSLAVPSRTGTTSHFGCTCLASWATRSSAANTSAESRLSNSSAA